jgi:hypothetical protein
MANALYDSAKVLALTTGMGLVAGTVKAQLVSSTYVYSAAHQFFSSVTGAVGTAQTLASKTTGAPAAGVFDAADITFPLTTGSAANAIVLYVDTGTAATSPLIAYIDTATGLPVTPNGGDITVVWDNTGNRIFAL